MLIIISCISIIYKVTNTNVYNLHSYAKTRIIQHSSLGFAACLSKDSYFFCGSAEDDICISNAQYCHLSAQRNLWCEILEF